MIKVLHTADWHLGKWLDNVSRLPEQKEVLEEIIAIADKENVQLVLIAGDLFDTSNPSAEAQELFYKTLKRLGNNGKRVVIAIAGNHDQPERIEAPDHLARECGILFIGHPKTKVQACEMEHYAITKSDEGFVEVLFKDSDVPVRIIHTPYANELRLKTYLGSDDAEAELRDVLQSRWGALADAYCDEHGVNLLCTHLFFQVRGEEAQEEPEDEKPILYVGGAQPIYSENIPASIQYVALGHLHRYQVIDNTQCPIVYSSSPLPYSFAEAGQDKYVVLIEAEPAKPVTFNRVKLEKGKKLLRQRFESIEDAVVWLKEKSDALVEVTIVSDEFLSIQERQQLHKAHTGIISIIPEVRNKEFRLNTKGVIDLSKSMEQLFIDYFRHQKGQEPNDDLIQLFKEIQTAESATN